MAAQPDGPDDALGSVAAVILAAGAASRFGAAKLAEPLHGRPVIAHVVDAARRAGLGDVCVVVGHHRAEVERALASAGTVRIIVNEEPDAGLSSSLQCALRALAESEQPSTAAVLLLGDEPTVSPRAIRQVALAAAAGSLVRARYDAGDGHPVGLPRSRWERAMLEVHGDRGLGPYLSRSGVRPVPVPGPRPMDIDDPGDLVRAREQR